MEMDTIKNNKNIAIYMGGKTYDKSKIPMQYQHIWLPIHGLCRWDTVDLGKGKVLKYHKSWDWLIPVICKIISENLYTYYLSDANNMGLFINAYSINDTYLKVVKFIDWYNDLIKSY